MSAQLIVRLLDSLDALGVIARRLQPPLLETLVATIGDRDDGLRAASAGAVWPENLLELRDPVAHAVEATLRACDGLRAAAGSPDGPQQAYRALRQVSRALEALYPLASVLPSVNRFFVEPEQRDDQALLDRLRLGAARPDVRTGVMHVENDTGERGGFSVYVPEDYNPAHAASAGDGAARRLRPRQAVPVELAARGAQPRRDPGRAHRDRRHLVADGTGRGRCESCRACWSRLRSDWHVDRTRLLLTGMSDGGTFTLLSGLDEASPFTHLAPVAASFHPLLLTMAEPRRVTGLPVYLVHGALDWMFPVSIARTAQRALTAAGAKVTYREIADLSHTYPREEGSRILNWLLARSGH